MSAACPVCGHHNPAHAHFCARCGRALIAGRVSAPTDELRNFALLVAAIAVVVSVVVAFRSTMGSSQYGRDDSSLVFLRRDYDLSPPKAEALHDLIAPKNIRVIVGRRTGGVFVKGTLGEVEILDRFVDILTRLDGLSAAEEKARMKEYRRTWTTTGIYKLPRRTGSALRRILAFDDVPVLVHGSTSKVRVDASPADQETIGDVVTILRGERRP